MFWRAQRHAPPRSGHRLDEPARLSLGNGCIPAVPASVSPGEIIVTPARGRANRRSACAPMEQHSRLGLPRLRRKLRTPGKRAKPKFDLCDRVVDFVLKPEDRLRPGEECDPLRGRASGSNDLPWALPRVLQAIPKIKRAADANGWCAGHGPGGVCSKDVSSTFGRDMRGSAIAARGAGRRRGPGRGGKPRRDTGTLRPANSNGTGKAGAIGSVSGSENHRQVKQFQTPRG